MKIISSNNIFCFICCVLICSCVPFEETGPSTLISGTIRDYYTGEPITAAVITIYYGHPIGYTPSHPSHRTLKELKSDDDGTFHYKFQTVNEHTYFAAASKAGYQVPGYSPPVNQASNAWPIPSNWIVLSKGQINENIDFELIP